MKKKKMTKYIAGLLSAVLLVGATAGNVVLAEEHISQEEIVTEEIASEEEIALEEEQEISLEVVEPEVVEPEVVEPEVVEPEVVEPEVVEPEVAEPEEAPYQSAYTYEDETVKVVATVEQAGVLPSDAVVKVERVTDRERVEKVYGLLTEEARKRDTGLIHYLVYDVSFTKDGQEIEPNGQVYVDIMFVETDTLAAASEGINTVQLFHVNSAEELEAIESEIVVSKQGQLEQMTFSSDEFSEYPVAVYGKATSGETISENAVQSEVMTRAGKLAGSGNTDAEDGLILDKKSTINADRTATISLEAHAIGEVITATNELPTDIVLVLDQSGSMNDPISKVYKEWYSSELDNVGFNTLLIKRNDKYEVIEYHDYWKQWHLSSETYPYETIIYPKASPEDTTPNSYVFYTEDLGAHEYNKKIKILQSAVSEFITTVRQDSLDRGVDNRIAVTGFSEEGGGTGVYIGGYMYPYKALQKPDDAGVYGQALVNTRTDADRLNASIANLKLYGATRADLGLEMANNIFAAYEAAGTYQNGERNKVVIMFTDGSPTANNGFEDKVANDSIAQAKNLKGMHGVTLYTAGVMAGLDPAADPSLSTTDEVNRYMQYVSSNFPNATSMGDAGIGGDYQSGHYMSATDAAELKEIFQSISSTVGSSSTALGKKAQLKDYISNSFDMSDLKEEDIKVYTASYKADGTWDEKKPFAEAITEIDKNNKNISVSNFDYSKEYCVVVEGTPQGKKLIVEVTVPVTAGFIGGNNVLTNTTAAGVYNNDAEVKKFPLPTVDVPLLYEFQSEDKSIYIGDDWKAVEQFFDNAEAGIQYELDSKGYTIDGMNNEYVNISYHVVDTKGNAVGTYTILAGQTTGTWNWVTAWNTKDMKEDTSYQIQLKVEPKDTKLNGVAAKESQKNAKLHVFKPTIEVADNTLFYGDTIDLSEQIKNVTWACSEVNAAKPDAAEPTLAYEYKPTDETIIVEDAAKFVPEADVDFVVSIKKDDLDITADTQIENHANTTTDNHDFTIFVVKGQLVIEKKIDKKYTNVKQINANQSFVFKIERRDTKAGQVMDTFYEVISFAKDDNLAKVSKTITGLKKGYYTVTEEEDWSKKYTLTASEDNYAGNTTETQDVLIGDQKEDASGEPTFYGLEQGKYDAVAGGVGAEFSFTNTIDKSWKFLSDAANAVNAFLN